MCNFLYDYIVVLDKICVVFYMWNEQTHTSMETVCATPLNEEFHSVYRYRRPTSTLRVYSEPRRKRGLTKDEQSTSHNLENAYVLCQMYTEYRRYMALLYIVYSCTYTMNKYLYTHCRIIVYTQTH